LQVDDNENYPAIVEASLAASRPLRLVNVGRASRSPADYVFDAAQYRQLVQPVWTVIQLNADDFGRDAFSPEKVHFREQATH
jgi:hypothetical protein